MATSNNIAPVKIRPSAALERRLSKAGRSLVAVEVSRRLALTIAAGIALLGVLILWDWLAELPLQTRKMLLPIAASATGLLAVWTLVGLFTQRRSKEQVALMVERQHPDFDSRLISAVQFAKGKAAIPSDAPSSMIDAMVADTEREAKRFRFSNIVDPRRCARAGLVLLAVVGGAGVGAFIAGDTLPVLIGRAFGQETPIPRATQIVSEPGDLRIGIGDRVELAFTAEGVLPSEAHIELKYASGRRKTIPLSSDHSPDAVSCSYLTALEDVPESFEFRAFINDAKSTRSEVIALERPSIASMSGRQSYPDFTHLAPTEHAPGDLALFPGAQLALQFVSTNPLAAAELRFVGGERSIALEIDAADPHIAKTKLTVPAENLSGFTVSLTDIEQMSSKDPAVYRVSLLADRPPEIRITYPKRADELVTRRARLLVRFEASDRFGIADAKLRYLRESGSGGELPIDIEPGAPKIVVGSLEWDLTKLEPRLTEGETVTYWLEASDQNSSRPNIGESHRLQIKVVSPDEKRADLLGRASDTLGGVGEATGDQEQLNQTLESIIRKGATRDRPDSP